WLSHGKRRSLQHHHGNMQTPCKKVHWHTVSEQKKKRSKKKWKGLIIGNYRPWVTEPFCIVNFIIINELKIR
ncbi:MAG TPA: hypothetical protein PLV81_05315, partial [Spirochaetota bacterium]|nr:hypothetical protein [Spirochaetota bacterium]